jgi:voltage-gated potassium channel Kch
MCGGTVTIATNGYGDKVPVTPHGKVIAGNAILIGVGLFCAHGRYA